MPMVLGYVFTVDWGDGTVEEYTGTASHTYSEEGTYTVSISGDFYLSSYVNYNKPSKYGWEKIVYLLSKLCTIQLLRIYLD